MIKIEMFTFNPFQENTYVLYDESGECLIIDPGCSNLAEEKQLTEFIRVNNLQPVKLLNTHAHIDHILGNRYVKEKWEIPFETHEGEVFNLVAANDYSMNFGFPPPDSPMPDKYIDENDVIEFGKSKLEILFVPGHSQAHIVFVSREGKFVIGGDVLFHGSIGRTDLPGGNHDLLLRNIKEKMYTLEDDFVVYPGHGPETSIGYEKKYNPFVRG